MARILIVDDCPLQRAVAQKVVESLGHRAILSVDGAAGIEAALRELPDLVLMDVVLPKIDGYSATRTLANHPAMRHIPVVIVTGRNQPSDCAWGFRQGAIAYVTKPVSAAALAGVIVEVLGGATGIAPA